MKLWLKILLIVLAAILLAGGITMLIFSLKYRNKTLDYVRYSSGGDMIGSYHSCKMSYVDGEPVLTEESMEFHSARRVTTVYKISEEDFGNVKKLMLDYNMYLASKMPLSKHIVLDGATSSISFDFEESVDGFSVSDNQALTNRQSKGFRAIRDYMFDLTDKTEGVTTVEKMYAFIYTDTLRLKYLVSEDIDDNYLYVFFSEADIKTDDDGNRYYDVNNDYYDMSEVKTTDHEPAGSLVYIPDEERVIMAEKDMDLKGVYVIASLDDTDGNMISVISDIPDGEYYFELKSESDLD